MKLTQTLGLHKHLTYKGNLKHTRYGWLRLTPAYSVHLVSDLLETHKNKNPVVLDPFCGTGTTALVCAEKGIKSYTTDINPFLVWLAHTKTRFYKAEEITAFVEISNVIIENICTAEVENIWIPPLH
ncbi:DNA methyltransferase [Scytonema sp. NUACC26]|uniref:DNA methyltransferase n=1 Tax=Scytonema sp. NUACC26 TaxID=3140176 RepID=UPI0034DC5D6A